MLTRTATVAIVLCILTLLPACIVEATPYTALPDTVPWQFSTTRGTASDPLRIGIIFARFPNTIPSQRHLTPGAHAVLNEIGGTLNYLSNNGTNGSGPYFTLTVLYDPRDSTNTEMWDVPRTSDEYADPPPPLLWDDYTAPGTAPSHGAEFTGDVLAAMQAAYDELDPSYQWTSPLANCDMVVFVAHPTKTESYPTPYGGETGGMDGSGIIANCPRLARIMSGAPIATFNADPWHQFEFQALLGCRCLWWNFDDDLEAKLIRSTFLHETGHMMGLAHSPEACLYGPYSVMRNKIEGSLTYGFHDHVARYLLDWTTPMSVTANHRNVELDDYGSSAQTYTVPLSTSTYYNNNAPPYDQFNSIVHVREYLLLAYEGARDSFYEPQDTGLYVWHVLESATEYTGVSPHYWTKPYLKYLDLEVATGRFSDPSVCHPPTATYWQSPNAANGYDTLDRYFDICTGLPRSEGEYSWYNGSHDDLFNYCPVDQTSEKPECSFRTNPTSYGLVYSEALLRDSDRIPTTTPNAAPNSIMVRIKEQSPSSVTLDILLAPYEDVSFPNGGDTLYSNRAATITWAVDATLHITSVDIQFTRDGATYATIASGVANDGHYNWTPSDSDATTNGKIRLVYHNDLSTQTGDDESDAAFTVVAVPVFYDDRSDVTGLVQSDAAPYSSALVDYNGDGAKDLFVTFRDAGGKLYRNDGATQGDVPGFSNRTAYDIAAGSEPQTGLRGIAVADYDNDGVPELFVAAESGARLYRRTSGELTDVASSAGLTNYATQSWAGAWGDYDRDGQLDLYICRGSGSTQDPTPTNVGAASGHLLHNKWRTNGGFEDVTASTGIGTTSSCASVAGAWADIDGDNALDLIVGDIRAQGGGQQCRLYRNNGNGTFTEGFTSRVPATGIEGITSVSWADFNNDGHMDLVLGSALHDPKVYVNDGTGQFSLGATASPAGGAAVTGVRAYDYDNDGRVDLVALPKNAADHPWLFRNQLVGGTMQLTDISSEVGWASAVGRVDGAVVSDYDHDGKSDVFLGRPTTSGNFFYRTLRSATAPTADWVGVHLGPSGANNASAIGAAVTFKIGTAFQQTQVVDGGSGRGGQNDSTLICGLGDIAGPVQAEIRWPGGFVQTQSLTRGIVNEVPDLTVPTIRDGSVSFTYEMQPGTNSVDWIFQWVTEYSSDPKLDQVTVGKVAGQPTPCVPGNPIVLLATDPAVSASVTSKVGGGYTHVLRWCNLNCAAPCNFSYTVRSATQQGQNAERTRTCTISVCPTDYDPNQEP